MEKYDWPGNCEKLTVLKVNPEIWCKLLHATRDSEQRLADLQKTLVNVSVALTKSTASLLNIKANHTSSDAELQQQLANLVANNMDTFATLCSDQTKFE